MTAAYKGLYKGETPQPEALLQYIFLLEKVIATTKIEQVQQ